MRHRKAIVKLGRTASHRKAMLRNLATSLFESQSIVTTVDKAKALRPVLDRLVNMAKKGDLASYRRGLGFVNSRKVLKDLFAQAKEGKVGKDRDSGHVSTARVGVRPGDAATMVKMTLITEGYVKAGTGSTKVRPEDRSRRVAASKAREQAKAQEKPPGEPEQAKGQAQDDTAQDTANDQG
jgi:large subunit ribosomal protein L17